jgi:hypothetical protein
MKALALLAIPVIACTAVACDRRSREVSHPFYVQELSDSTEQALYRCPDGPDGGCAIDGLPGPNVVAAGADDTHVVVAQQSNGRVVYFYFARVPEEAGAYGLNPELIVGPLDRRTFEQAKKQLSLPDFDIDDR